MKTPAEKSMVRVRKFYRENSVFFDYSHEPYKPPVRITDVGTSHWGPGDSYTTKKRRQFGLNLVTNGKFFFNQRNFKGYVHSGQVFLCHINFEQSFFADEKGFSTKRFILFEGELIQAHLSLTRLSEYDVITPASPIRLKSFFREAYRVMREKREGFVEKLMLLNQQIFMELGRSIVDDYPDELNQGIAYVQRNLHRAIKLEEISRIMRVSGRQCVRLFNTYTKMPPIQFVHVEKQKWAESLLQQSNLSVKEIASILGYDDPFYFSNRFKQFNGNSPSEYRKAMQG